MAKRKPLFLSTLAIALAIVFALSSATLATDFTAQRTVEDSEGLRTEKAYVSGDKMRYELDMAGEAQVTIIRLDKNVAWMVMPMDMYFEIPVPRDPSVLASRDYDEVRLGVETINGHVCDVIMYTFADDSYGSATHWVSRTLKYPIKIEEMDSNGNITMRMEYAHIKQGTFPASVFEVPAGFQKISLPGGLAMPGGSDIPAASGTPAGFGMPGGFTMPSGSNMPAGYPGPFGAPAVPDIPQVYRGTITVEINGERVWEVTEAGECGVDVVRHELRVMEKAEILIPPYYIMAGAQINQNDMGKGILSFHYEKHEYGKLMKIWTCADQVYQTPSGCHYAGIAFISHDTYTVKFGGFWPYYPKGECIEYAGNGDIVYRGIDEYYGHEVVVEAKLPSGGQRIFGVAEVPVDTMYEDDWLVARISWDFSPLLGY